MTTAQTNPSRPTSAEYDNAAEWLEALGDIPPERIAMDPWPGTASEYDDVVDFIEHQDRIVELVSATLVEKPPGFWEATIATRLGYEVFGLARGRKLGVVLMGKMPIRMTNGNVRVPSILFIESAAFGGRPHPNEDILSIPAALIAEVLRAENTTSETRRKLEDYFQSGARLVWIVDPRAKAVSVYEALTPAPTQIIRGNEKLDGADVLPGFSFQVSDLFTNDF